MIPLHVPASQTIDQGFQIAVEVLVERSRLFALDTLSLRCHLGLVACHRGLHGPRSMVFRRPWRRRREPPWLSFEASMTKTRLLSPPELTAGPCIYGLLLITYYFITSTF